MEMFDSQSCTLTPSTPCIIVSTRKKELLLPFRKGGEQNHHPASPQSLGPVSVTSAAPHVIPPGENISG